MARNSSMSPSKKIRPYEFKFQFQFQQQIKSYSLPKKPRFISIKKFAENDDQKLQKKTNLFPPIHLKRLLFNFLQDFMDSSARFRFRDSTGFETGSDDSSSVSSAEDDESKIESLTAKGVKRLCSELIELKKASDEDFHNTLHLNYSAFVRIFEQAGGVENEIMHLKQQFLTQRLLVKDLMDSMYLEILSKESIDLIIDEPLDLEESPVDNLEAHANAISETLDILLLEHKLDEALVVLELEDINLKMLQEENPVPSFLLGYDSAISERKSRLSYLFARVADHPRVCAPEFQKALSGLCRLGDSHCAIQLLLKFYRLHLENGVHDLQISESYLHGTYIRDLAKFVFSMISQAAGSFVLLFGEKSLYASELIQWAREETEVFASYFHKYVKSVSEVNGGLATASEAVQYAISYCSILETQSILLCPYLVKLIRPYMEEVLNMHLDHYNKVIRVFTETDDWVLGKYLIPGIVKEEVSSKIIGHKTEYCLLTNSGRKLVTLLQATMNEGFSLVILQMENSIFDGILELYKEYIDNLERAIPSKENVLYKVGSRIVLAQKLSQQISVLANASALVHIVSTTARSIFKGFENSDCKLITDSAVESKKLDKWMSSIQNATNQLKNIFYQHFIASVISPEEGPIFSAENYYTDQSDSNAFENSMPSHEFQVLFRELRQLEKVGKDILVEVDWLVELLRELMEALFAWLQNNQEFWITIDENLNSQQTDGFEQFVLDMIFLVEITRFGGYCSSNLVDASMALISRMESVFLFAGVDPHRDLLADEWATNAATEAIQKLLDAEESEFPQNKGHTTSCEEDLNTNKYACASDSIAEDSPESDNPRIVNICEEPVCDVLDNKGAPVSIDRSVESKVGNEIANANSGAIRLLTETEIREEAPPIDIVLEACYKSEDEKILNSARSSFDSISSTDELVESVDDRIESPMVEISGEVAENSENGVKSLFDDSTDSVEELLENVDDSIKSPVVEMSDGNAEDRCDDQHHLEAAE